MELTIDFVKELTNRAEEIGKLKEQIKQKDIIISGLISSIYLFRAFILLKFFMIKFCFLSSLFSNVIILIFLFKVYAMFLIFVATIYTSFLSAK